MKGERKNKRTKKWRGQKGTKNEGGMRKKEMKWEWKRTKKWKDKKWDKEQKKWKGWKGDKKEDKKNKNNKENEGNQVKSKTRKIKMK